jgi:hypothetical protein
MRCCYPLRAGSPTDTEMVKTTLRVSAGRSSHHPLASTSAGRDCPGLARAAPDTRSVMNERQPPSASLAEAVRRGPGTKGGAAGID